MEEWLRLHPNAAFHKITEKKSTHKKRKISSNKSFISAISQENAIEHLLKKLESARKILANGIKTSIPPSPLAVRNAVVSTIAPRFCLDGDNKKR